MRLCVTASWSLLQKDMKKLNLGALMHWYQSADMKQKIELPEQLLKSVCGTRGLVTTF